MKDDFLIQISTENGTGSLTANKILSRALINEGYFVSSKNLFPSNIAGLPTNFMIRMSKEGFSSYSSHKNLDLIVCFNSKTIDADLKKAHENSATVITKEEFKKDLSHFEKTPLLLNGRKLTKDLHSSIGVRKLLQNMLYVGAVLKSLSVSEESGFKALQQILKNLKPELFEANKLSLEVGYENANELFMVEKPQTLPESYVFEGNQCLSLGLLDGGAQVFTWYPITPSSSVAESFIKQYDSLFSGETEKERSILQCEDELSAVTAALGAGWSGARSVTATSGPGLSLMQETIGLGYFSESPFVVVDIQRAGPSTGLPTRTAQGDLLLAYYSSHGDSFHPVLLPASPKDCYEDGFLALSLAQDLQTPVFILSDLDIGMNEWITDQISPMEKDLSKGKYVIDPDENFKRYSNSSDVSPRSIPRVSHESLAYFTRGSGHDEAGNYSESPEVYQAKLDRLKNKISHARSFSDYFPEDIVNRNTSSKTLGLIYYGSSSQISKELVHELKKADLAPSTYQVRALPLNKDLKSFIEDHEVVMVVEQNRDGQLQKIITSELEPQKRVHSVRHYNGHPIDPISISEQIKEALKKEKEPRL